MFLIFAISTKLQAAPIQNEGSSRVSVNGQIIASACSIHTDDIRQEILFDALSQRTVRDNSVVGEKAFSLRLTNCRLEKETQGEWKSVTVTFDGEVSSRNSSLFLVNGNSRGLALKLTSADGEQAFPGVSMNKIPLNREGLRLDYKLKVVHDGESFEEGFWFASLRFMVAYL